ncbi:3-phosphoshikimate 1-carboxyvinyltransferase [Hyphococcus luteus]|uniref:3-phosphoshikimate 1-carboxyvinyltransferase n=1 Tax=Hyphococcus luteus TaxID=2058213 RepID=A0A2S7K843_9PROT|nr:3-phosphoshikimate 1-carboxyvinyltransferase [Marinicaulis flavus]PQA88675.1 3-phosphoshikimate 1-carboxyvinyltransferase [Marinicaulis flavus]
MTAPQAKPARLATGRVEARRSGPLSGAASAPGDKSISHRALILGALSGGETRTTGLLEADDVLRTAAAMRALGAEAERDGTGGGPGGGSVWRVTGAPWRSPERALYLGNSGTGVRLIMGAVAGAGVAATFDGDVSLRARPMGRVLEPLRMMGLETSDENGRLPVTIEANGGLKAVDVKLAAPSAQVKSAILLAALGAEGVTRIHEPELCRDHTERMLSAFGVDLATQPDGEGGRFIEIAGGQALVSCDIVVPGDPSSAAFPVAAALIVPNSDVTIKGVLVNPLRAGFYETLREMGADISFENTRVENGEPVADIRARHSVLRGVEVPADRAPSMIDEYPILAVVAAHAHGETMMTGLEELRVKESDRIACVEAGLAANGGDAASGPDWLRVRGQGQPLKGGAMVKTHHDHRIAMSFLVAGLASEKPVEIDDASMIATSFPDFFDLMTSIGAEMGAA